MKQIITALLVLLATFSQAQEKEIIGKVKYIRAINFSGEPTEMEFNLFIGRTSSMFIEQPKEETGDSVKIESTSDDEFALVFNITYGTEDRYAVETDLADKKLRSRVSIYKGGKSRTVIVEEKIQPVDWKLFQEFKSIGGLQCQKATGRFRGRDYTVWFSRQIPSRLGPWKLNGLPGLILEAKDATNEVMFYATQVNFPYNAEKAIMPQINDKRFEIITLEEYVGEKRNQVDQMVSLVNSKLPRGATMSVLNETSHELELTYEFEEKN